MTYPARNISISINRPFDDVYQFASNPENLSLWIAFIKSVSKNGDTWLATTDIGDIRIRFVVPNNFGVIDHLVMLSDGETVNNPMRVTLNELSLNDVSFIKELVNTPEWIKFIGDRNIHTYDEAKVYVQKIIENPHINYWVVKLKNHNISIGIITFIKRDYLEHYDIGFAFLPQHYKKGFAYEATIPILNDAMNNDNHRRILATTIQKNVSSIKLLERLGLRYEKQVKNGKDLLLIYSLNNEKPSINQITNTFFDLFTSAKEKKLQLEKIFDICFSVAIIIKKSIGKEEVFNIDSFISLRKKILTDGSLTEFEEYEVFEDTKIVGNLAQRFSKYEKKGYLNGSYFEEKGNKFFQYVKTVKGWKINSVIWEDNEVIRKSS